MNGKASRALIGALLLLTVQAVTLALLRTRATDGFSFDPNGYVFPPSTALMYFAGVATAQLVNALPADGVVRGSRAWLVLDLVYLAVFLSLYLVPEPWAVTSVVVAELAGPTFGCLVCFNATCAYHGLVMRVLASPAFSSLAQYSYAAYLLQWFAIRLLDASYGKEEPLYYYLALYGLIFLGAVAVHLGVEQPFSRHAAKRLLAPRAEGEGARSCAGSCC